MTMLSFKLIIIIVSAIVINSFIIPTIKTTSSSRYINSNVNKFDRNNLGNSTTTTTTTTTTSLKLLFLLLLFYFIANASNNNTTIRIIWNTKVISMAS